MDKNLVIKDGNELYPASKCMWEQDKNGVIVNGIAYIHTSKIKLFKPVLGYISPTMTFIAITNRENEDES